MKKRPGKCSTKFCKRDKAKGRTICRTCESRIYRKNNRMMASYHNLKNNSKRRGHLFLLSFEDFRELCYETKYLQGVGKTKTSLTLDKIIPALGYVKGNIQILPNHENARKGNKILNYDWTTKTATVTRGNDKSIDFYF